MKSRTTPSLKFAWETRGFKQEALRAAIMSKPVTFAIGCAGTGKSLIATYCALDLLDKSIKNGGVDRLIVTRPLVTVGEEFGTLPGDMKTKIDPYLRPIYDIIKNSSHPRTQEMLYSEGDSSCLEGMPVATMRGMTFSDCVVIVDEAQNLRREQIKMILTRLGSNAKIIFTGDTTQSDLKAGMSGLEDAVCKFRNDPAVEVVEFGLDDIQRHDFVGRVIRAYAEDAPKPKK